MIAKYILKENTKAYDKGVLAEILEPIMGKGLIPADPETWRVRRRAIVPGFHKGIPKSITIVIQAHKVVEKLLFSVV